MPYVRVPADWAAWDAQARRSGGGGAELLAGLGAFGGEDVFAPFALEGAETARIYYEVHGRQGGPARQASGAPSSSSSSSSAQPHPPRQFCILLMGLAAASPAWAPQLPLFGGGTNASGLLVDNRGIGRSESPREASCYSTEAMARDALACVAHAGWLAHPMHVVGHSMGGMVACKLAALLEARRARGLPGGGCASLVPISSSLGGLAAAPPLEFLAGAAARLATSGRSARASFDLWVHFSKEWLAQRVRTCDSKPLAVEAGAVTEGDEVAPEKAEAGAERGSHETETGTGHGLERARAPSRREALLHSEYLETSLNGGEQAPEGLRGQMRAVRAHKLTRDDRRAIHRGAFPVLVIHGAQDMLATEAAGRALAARLGARALFIALSGAHFCCRENASEVNALLGDVLRGGDGSGAGDAAAFLERAATLWHAPSYGYCLMWCCCGLGRPRSHPHRVWKMRALKDVAIAAVFSASLTHMSREHRAQHEEEGAAADEVFVDASAESFADAAAAACVDKDEEEARGDSGQGDMEAGGRRLDAGRATARTPLLYKRNPSSSAVGDAR